MISPYLIPGIARYVRPARTSDIETANSIIDVICKYKGIPREEMVNEGRHAYACEARELAMYFIKKRTRLTLRRIGQIFSGRHYSTVIHAVKKVGDLSDVYRENREQIFELQNLIIYEHEQTKNIISIRATQGQGGGNV